jgi:hypothetical protein
MLVDGGDGRRTDMSRDQTHPQCLWRKSMAEEHKEENGLAEQQSVDGAEV